MRRLERKSLKDFSQLLTYKVFKNTVTNHLSLQSDVWLDLLQLYDVLSHIKSLQCIALIHAENGSLIKKKTEFLKEKGAGSHPDAVLAARDEDVSVFMNASWV